MIHNHDFEIKNGVLVAYHGFDKTVVIPDSVTAISDNAFAYRHYVKSITIPDSVTFDYHRYKQTLWNTGFNHRVAVVMVNPRNTSKIGRQKYCKQKKLNVHQSASYVIARRGQGYIDRLVA